MGGTTAKICVVRDGRPEVTTRFWLGGTLLHRRAGDGHGGDRSRRRQHRLGGRGRGRSTWARGAPARCPGPACYGKGGTEPTVTDADLVLGYINADYYLGGDMTVDVEAAGRPSRRRSPTGWAWSVAEAAHGIYRLVNANMIGATRVVTVQRGHDPRDFTLVVSGGTAAIHAVRMAQELAHPPGDHPLNAGRVLGRRSDHRRRPLRRPSLLRRPALPGRSRPHARPSSRRSPGRPRAKIEELGFAPRRRSSLRYEIDMRYLGQAHEVPVEVPQRAGRRGWTELAVPTLERLSSTRSICTCSDTTPGSRRWSS